MLLVVVGAALGGGVYYRLFGGGSAAQKQAFRTEEVTRGDLHVTVGATGTVEPEEVVDVGAQVVGRIKELGKDLRGKDDPAFAEKTVDYGSPVDKGNDVGADRSFHLRTRSCSRQRQTWLRHRPTWRRCRRR